jgi:hypothetical protein
LNCGNIKADSGQADSDSSLEPGANGAKVAMICPHSAHWLQIANSGAPIMSKKCFKTGRRVAGQIVSCFLTVAPGNRRFRPFVTNFPEILVKNCNNLRFWLSEGVVSPPFRDVA